MNPNPRLSWRLWQALSPPLRQQTRSLKTVRRKGTSHEHIRLVGPGLIARIPRHCPKHQTPEQALSDQAARFRYGQSSLHIPALYAILEPSPTLPFGALLVNDVRGGRLPRSFKDFHSIAKSLAAIHTLDSPEPPADLLSSVLALIAARWPYVSRFSPESLRLLNEELQKTTEIFSSLIKRYSIPSCWIGNDTHPGNFLIDPQGKAWFVDLEKAAASLPAVDLAHTTLYTSTIWALNTALSSSQIDKFYHTWSQEIPPPLARQTRPWFKITRPLIWLRTLSWMAQWFHTADLSLFPHRLTRCIRDFFEPSTVRKIRAQFHE